MTPSNLQLQTAETPRATSVVLRSAHPAMEKLCAERKEPFSRFLQGFECWREHNCLGVKRGEGGQSGLRKWCGKNKREGNEARRGRNLQRYSAQKG